MEPSFVYQAGATAFSHLELFSELVLEQKYDIISHTSYLPLTWTSKISSLHCLAIQNGGRIGLVVLGTFRYKFLFFILLCNQVFREANLGIVTKKQLRLNTNVLIVNGEKHQRKKLIVRVSVRPKQIWLNKQEIKKVSSCRFFF